MRWLTLALFACACSSSDPTAVPSGADAGSDASYDAASDAADAAADSALDAGTFSGPQKLSETGLFADISSEALAPGVIEYDVRYSLWADGAEKKRYLLLPPGTQIDTKLIDYWKFPIGTKAWKSFSKDGKRIETRFLRKDADGPDGWLEVAYLWDADGLDATAAPMGVTDAAGTTHDVPSQEQCAQCHNGESDVLIGVSAFQLSRESGGGPLTDLANQGLLSNPPAAELPIPGDGVVEDALGYLHANCGHCHNDTSFVGQKRALRLKLLSTSATPEETPTYLTTIGAKMNHVLDGTTLAVVPGKPAESQLVFRMSIRNLEAMPPVGTEVVDATGVKTIGDWISGLP